MQTIITNYISRLLLVVLLLSNLFALNSYSGNEYKNAPANTSLIIESAAIQDFVIAAQKTTKLQFQKLSNLSLFEVHEKSAFSTKFKNFTKISPQDFSLLNFQFFLSSQFSTDT